MVVLWGPAGIPITSQGLDASEARVPGWKDLREQVLTAVGVRNIPYKASTPSQNTES